MAKENPDNVNTEKNQEGYQDLFIASMIPADTQFMGNLQRTRDSHPQRNYPIVA